MTWMAHARTPFQLGEKIHLKTAGRDMKTHELNIWSITNYTNDFHFVGNFYYFRVCAVHIFTGLHTRHDY